MGRARRGRKRKAGGTVGMFLVSVVTLLVLTALSLLFVGP